MVVPLLLAFIGTAQRSWAIEGGSPVPSGEAPWQAMLNADGLCGATILAERWILTAAHCTVEVKTSDIEVAVGSAKRDELTQALRAAEPTDLRLRVGSVQVRRAERVWEHRSYAAGEDLDLALIFLSAPLEFSNHVQPLALATRDEVQQTHTAEVTGFGIAPDPARGPTLPRWLHKARVKVLPPRQCAQSFGVDINQVICAGGKGADTTTGDSGGPMVLINGDGEPRLMGVTSFGIGTAKDGTTGAYSRIVSSKAWLYGVIAHPNAAPTHRTAHLRPNQKCGFNVVTMLGSDADDKIIGTPGPDVIRGLGGDDTIDGAGGRDVICGDRGNDRIVGGVGDDYIEGGDGADTILGGSGNDRLLGGAQRDVIRGGGGDDVIVSGDGDDEVYANRGRDSVDGGNGDDTIFGGAQDDQLFGGAGRNELFGGAGSGDGCFLAAVVDECEY